MIATGGRARIALIHATPLSMPPVLASLARLWPEAEPFHLLDDSLARDRERGTSAIPFPERFRRLASYALAVGARGILFTCSAFGEAIEACRAGLPVPALSPGEAMIEEALDRGGSIGLVATFAPTLDSMEAEFREAALRRGRTADLRTVLATGAGDALRAGEVAGHDLAVARAAEALRDRDVVCLAQFSMATAAAAVARATARPVLTTPDSAVRLLRSRLG